MNAFKRLAAAGAVLTGVFAPAAFADEPVDKTGNGIAMADCQIEKLKQSVIKTFNSGMPRTPEEIRQETVGAITDCAALVTGIDADQIPPVAMPPEIKTPESIAAFRAASERFNAFMDQYVDYQTFETEMDRRYPEVMQLMTEQMQRRGPMPPGAF